MKIKSGPNSLLSFARNGGRILYLIVVPSANGITDTHIIHSLVARTPNVSREQVERNLIAKVIEEEDEDEAK